MFAFLLLVIASACFLPLGGAPESEPDPEKELDSVGNAKPKELGALATARIDPTDIADLMPSARRPERPASD